MKCLSNTSPRHQNVTSKKTPPKPWLFENSGDNGLTRAACRMKNGGGQSAADRRIAAVVCPSAHETESGASATWVQAWAWWRV